MVETAAFNFPDRNSMYFSCKIRLCYTNDKFVDTRLKFLISRFIINKIFVFSKLKTLSIDYTALWNFGTQANCENNLQCTVYFDIKTYKNLTDDKIQNQQP